MTLSRTELIERMARGLICAGLLLTAACVLALCSAAPAAVTAVAHNDQGDFAVVAPDAATAGWFYAQASAAGVQVEMAGPTAVTGKLLCPNHWLWWWDIRPKLTGCVVSGGAEGRPIWSGDNGAEG